MESEMDMGQIGAVPTPLHLPRQMPFNQQLSPYLDIDPSIFKSAEPQYILPEGASAKRGRLELAFSQIGGGVFAGYLWGSAVGAGLFLRDPSARSLPPKARLNQMLNYHVKHGPVAARALGTVMLTYSVVGVLGANLLPVADELNTIASATATGLVYKAPMAYATRSALHLAKGSLVGCVCGTAAVGLKYLWERY